MKKPIINIKEENLYVDRDENPKILAEARKASDKLSALKLYCLMRFLSDDLFMCSWLMDIDEEMFNLLGERRKNTLEQPYINVDSGFVNISVSTVDLLKSLIVKSGGIWNGREQFVFVEIKGLEILKK